MADGDEWSLDRTTCTYTTDGGKDCNFAALTHYQQQAALGWVVNADPSLLSAPKGLKPRVWLMWDAGDHSQRRRVVVATNAAYAAGVIGTTTLSVQNPSTDVEDTFTLYGKEGERLRGQRRS